MYSHRVHQNPRDTGVFGIFVEHLGLSFDILVTRLKVVWTTLEETSNTGMHLVGDPVLG